MHSIRRAIDIHGQSRLDAEQRRPMSATRRKRTEGGGAPDVQLAVVAAVPALLREAGLDPAPLLRACGLADAAFGDPDARVPFVCAARLLRDVALATGREDLGLVAGERAGAGSVGLLLPLMQRAASVGEALDEAARHLSLHDRGGAAYLRRGRAGTAALGYAVHDAATPGLGVVYDLALAINRAVLRMLCGPRWRAIEVHLPHARPKRPERWRRHFGAPIVFDATAAEIWFDARWLGERPPFADHAAHRAVLRDVQRDAAQHAPSWAERARHASLALAMTGALCADTIAHSLALHPRTLRRRLEGEGVRLRTLINEARFDLACQLLRETHVPLAEVAAALGYADLTAFVRAFRGWAGCGPGQWRAQAAASST